MVHIKKKTLQNKIKTVPIILMRKINDNFNFFHHVILNFPLYNHKFLISSHLLYIQLYYLVC